jgi:excisionase family DNA binding protein
MKPPASKKIQLLRVDEVAVILNCSRRSVYRLIGDCELSALKIRSGLRISADSVDCYIKRQISIYQENNGIGTAFSD